MCNVVHTTTDRVPVHYVIAVHTTADYVPVHYVLWSLLRGQVPDGGVRAGVPRTPHTSEVPV